MMKKDSGAHTQLEHAPKKIMIVVVAGPTGAVHGSFSVMNFCQSAKSKNLLLTPLSFFAWLLQVSIHKDVDMQNDVTIIFDTCIGTRKRNAILSSTLPLILALYPCFRDWTHFICKLELPPDVKYIERNACLGDFGIELSEASKLNAFKGFVEITIGQVHADSRIADEFHVAYAMNIGDTKKQVMSSLQGCLVCGRSNERTHCHDCGALYCSREHQKDDWPRHKSYCKAVKAHRHHVHTNFKRMAKNKGWAQIWYGVIEMPHPWATTVLNSLHP